MANESRKSYQFFSEFEQSILQGSVVDIGAGPDKIVPHALGFDQDQGDANHISQYIDNTFDCVYSSHCLEHMQDPQLALQDWWRLVKADGYLFFIVPDEDLYEQGVFPSRFNGDHKFTFTLSKKKSWSPVSVNVFDMVRQLADCEIVSLNLNDINYDRAMQKHGNFRAGAISRFFARQMESLEKPGIRLVPASLTQTVYQRNLIDQTRKEGLAQIEVILRKRSR
jgi:SAM-dependent methyltransferase